MYRSLRCCLILVFLFVAGCEEPPADESAKQGWGPQDPVRIGLNWYPEAEHGGYYAAIVNKHFEKQGIYVEITPGGPDTPIMQQVARGYSHFGVTNADQLLLAINQGAPLVALMAPIQNSPRCLMVHADSDIKRFDQLQDMTIGMRGGAAWAEFLKQELPLSGVEIVPPGNLALFLEDKTRAQQGYVFSEPFVAEKQGFPVRSLMVSDLGFNPYTSVLFCDRYLLDSDPELVRRLVAACQSGWQDYLDDPESTNVYIHEQNPKMDLDVLAYGASALVPLCATPEDQSVGSMTNSRWQTLVDQMVGLTLIKSENLMIEKLFTNEFLPSVSAAAAR